MNPPKKHHYLPQFYLRYFKIVPQDTKFPQIWIFPKQKDTSGFSSSIKDTACIVDYHSLEGSTGIKDRSTFETAVSKIEYQQEKLIRRILQAKIMNQKDKAGMASFLSLMRTRVPSFRSYVEETHKAAVLAMSDLAYKHGRLPPPPQVLEPYLKGKTISDIVTVEIANWMLLKYMFDAAINSRFAEVLYRMNSTLIECPSSNKLPLV